MILGYHTIEELMGLSKKSPLKKSSRKKRRLTAVSSYDSDHDSSKSSTGLL